MALRPAAKRTAARTTAGKRTARPVKRTFDALRDTVDFRDQLYIPTLVEVKPASDLARFRRAGIPVLDQGSDGACTGFALATVVNYLLRTGQYGGTADAASAHMLYVMAKRYDEWPGEKYDGSSARGAMKGWHKHGVCAARLFRDLDTDFSDRQAADALKRPLGAYFRVNHKDLVAMHSAITEAGVLFATANVHEGWSAVKRGTREIAYSSKQLGGHAFAIVGYDREGFWIQNSWGRGWGSSGLARLGYADWLENGTDVWVARLGAPISLSPTGSAPMRAGAPRSYESYVYAALRPHVVTAGNNGELLQTGSYGLTPAGVQNVVREQLEKAVSNWPKKRVMLYAHGGLVSEESALQYAANYRDAALKAQVYPIAFIWRTDFWTTVGNILQDSVSKRKTEGLLDAAKDFMLDRLDDTLEPLARNLGGKALWDEMKRNAWLCSSDRAGPKWDDQTAADEPGAAWLVAKNLVDAVRAKEIDEIHLVAHSAGSILLAPLARYFVDNGVKVTSLSLWAPACTMELFKATYMPLFDKGIDAFDLYTLDDATEQDDDCANIYHKSLLYFVSHAFERTARVPTINKNDPRRNGTPILGLERDIANAIPAGFWDGARHNWIKAPGMSQSHARHHGDFDNDVETLKSTLRRITGGAKTAAAIPSGGLTVPPAKTARVRAGVNIALLTPPRSAGRP